MTDVESLVTEARAFVDRENGLNWQGWIRELADALKKTIAERDRYHGIARSAELQCRDAEAEVARYRGAIKEALDVKMFAVGTHAYGRMYYEDVHSVLTRALREGKTNG